MRYSVLVFLLAAVVLFDSGCEQAGNLQKANPNSEPQANTKAAADREAPLLLEEDEPLLLLDDEPQATGPIADNSRCFVCHINYMEEDIAVIHARANIGCAGCHGASDDHIADESWASGGNGTAPDTMYPKEKINPFCMSCHTKEKIDAEQHKALFAGTSTEKYCTDCHGNHRLPERKCKWK